MSPAPVTPPLAFLPLGLTGINSDKEKLIKKMITAKDYPPLYLLIIQPTSFCNIDCSYCYLTGRDDAKRIDFSILDAIFAEISRSGIARNPFSIAWHSGEPLSLPLEFIEQLISVVNDLLQKYNLEADQTIQTNGTLIKEDHCKLFVKHNIRVGVSLDGPRHIHDRYRRDKSNKPTFDKVMAGINRLASNSVDFGVLSVLTRESLQEPEEMFNFYRDHGLYSVGFNIEEIAGANKASSLDREDITTLARRFYDKFNRLNWESGNRLKVREHIKANSVILLNHLREPINTLATPFSIVTINKNGDFSTFCPVLTETESDNYDDFWFGNILTDTFDSILHTDKFKQVYDEINQGIESCRSSCNYFFACGGGVPSTKLGETGSMSVTETMHCRTYLQAMVDASLSLIENRMRYL